MKENADNQDQSASDYSQIDNNHITNAINEDNNQTSNVEMEYGNRTFQNSGDSQTATKKSTVKRAIIGALLGLCLSYFLFWRPNTESLSSLEIAAIKQLQKELDQENKDLLKGRIKTEVKSLKLKKVSDSDYTGDAMVKVTIYGGETYDSYIKVDIYNYHHYDDGRFTYHYNFNRHDYIWMLNSRGIF